jgi:hypothetical protein
MVTFGDVFHVLWRAAEAFALNKGLTLVDLDGGKTGEEMASDRQYPGGVIGKFCGADVLQRSGFLRSEFDVFVAAHATTAPAARANARVEQQAGLAAELERAHQAYVAFETTSRRVASVQEHKEELYDEAVIIFEAILGTTTRALGKGLWSSICR